MRLIDVSNNNGRVRWDKVEGAGIAGAWVKLTEGVGYLDPLAAENVRGAHLAHLPVGCYHYARPDTGGDLKDAQAEAEWFLAHLHLRRGDLLPALDLERALEPGQSAAAVIFWAQHWLTAVWRALGVRPLLYSYTFYLLDELHGAAGLDRWPLWLANYGPNDGEPHPPVVPPGFTMVAHQYTSAGKVAGVTGNVDLTQSARHLLRGLTFQPK